MMIDDNNCRAQPLCLFLDFREKGFSQKMLEGRGRVRWGGKTIFGSLAISIQHTYPSLCL
jgi:hypothetical protein